MPMFFIINNRFSLTCFGGVDCVTDGDCGSGWFTFGQDICCDGKCKAVCAESGECNNDNDCFERWTHDYEDWDQGQCCDGQCKSACPGFYFLVVGLPCICLSLLIALGGAIAYCIVKASNQTTGTTGTAHYQTYAATTMPPTYCTSANFPPQSPNYSPQSNDKL